ncbi:MAG: hypothetical protein P4L53_10230 [Candidatus Obscuribacterales bacterium]|nr:hypothetical protein [Candidatus Obscuribacterales bacterium]
MKNAVIIFAFACLTQPAFSADTKAPNNNSDSGSFKSNYATSFSNQANQTPKTVTKVGKYVVADPRKNQAVMPGTQGLPESQVLLRHDDVAPGLNRQQAMELESQNGSLPPYVEQEMKAKGLLKDATKTTTKAVHTPGR